jgi:uncharacterized protein (TIGR04255 family)
VEALCQLRFDNSFPWDPTVPGMLYERLSGEYPKKTRRIFQEVKVNQDEKGIRQDLHITEGSHFLSDDEKDTILIAPWLIAVSRLAPYSSWEKFKPKIVNAIDKLCDVTAALPELKKAVLQYINHIKIPEEKFPLENYFNFRPFIGENLPQTIGSFFLGCIFPLKENSQLRIELVPIPNETPGHSIFALKLACESLQSHLFSQEEILQWIEDAHTYILEAFEGCVTDSLRTIFEEVQKA